MSISITKRNYLSLLALFTLLVGVAGGLVYFHFFPHHYFGGYPLIPAFFFVLGVCTIQMTEMCRRHAPARMMWMYLVVRLLRMLAAFMMMLGYCLVVRHEIRAFLMTFIANYLIYLTFDSWFYFTFEINRKIKDKEKK